MTGLSAAMASFEEGSLLLSELAGVKVNAKQVERTAEALGRQIAEDERMYVESDEQIASTLDLGVDGTGIPVRQTELVGRKGKQADGSAKTREVKLCTVWSAERRDKEGRPARDKGSSTYSAAIESAAARSTDDASFAQRVIREATRRGFDKAKRRAVLGDGAHFYVVHPDRVSFREDLALLAGLPCWAMFFVFLPSTVSGAGPFAPCSLPSINVGPLPRGVTIESHSIL
jgi:hypothetical protein